MRAGGVVLAGGRSSRMGRPKALLEWGGRTAVEHAVAVVREGVDGGPLCVVRAPGQELPALDALVAEDPVVFAGPLAALTEGLAALDGPVRGRVRVRRRYASRRAGVGACGRAARCAKATTRWCR